MPKSLVYGAAAGLALVFSGVRAHAQAPAAETIYIDGKVVTVDPAFSIAEAFAVTGEKFTAVGKSADVRKLAGPATRIVNLHGRTVIPGLEDSHLHNAGGGPGVDLSGARSMADVLAAVALRVKNVTAGETVVSNGDWHEAQLKEQRLPLRRDLDTVSPNNPVVLVRGGHEFILNSAALARWHIDKTTAAPEGGQISTYTDGEPNGELVDRARTLVTLPASSLTQQEQMDSWMEQFRKLNAAGLTSIRQPGIPLAQFRLFQEMKRRGMLTVRVNALLSAPPNADAASVRAFIESSGVKPDEGDEWVRIQGMKLIADGGFEGGWMREPYQEPYGKDGHYRGLQLIPTDRYIGIVRELNRLGWRVGTHAVGDAAMDQVLAGYEAANVDRSIVGKRWAIEHGFLPREEHFARMKALGLVVTVQNHLYLAGPSLVRLWGPQRAAWVTPVRAYLDHGISLAAGTDSSVVPYPPLWTIYHFVTRDTISGGVMGADQKITRQEALRLSTMGTAYLTFDERTKGSIEAGKLADFVVLAQDILTIPEKGIEQAKVLMTVVGGKAVFIAPGSDIQ
ncbi:MAG: amidohydrolase [Bryobacteraceae bacterium]|jgi:predicted amidohydrolase YtcJ